FLIAREDPAHGIPLALNPGQQRAGALEILLVSDGLGLIEERLAGLDLGCGIGFVGRGLLGTRRVERVAGGLEAGPERVIGFAPGTAGGLPVFQQIPVGADGVCATGRERLGAFDKSRLDIARLLVGVVQFGIERTALT